MPITSCDIYCLTTKIIVDEVVTVQSILLTGGKLNFNLRGEIQLLKQVNACMFHEFIQGKVSKTTILTPWIFFLHHISSVCK